MNFPLFSLCGWLRTGELCELTTLYNIFKCVCVPGYAGARVFDRAPGWLELALVHMAESITSFHISLQSGGFQWGCRSGALVTDTSNHFPITHLPSFPSAVVRTHTLTVRPGHSYRLQFQSWCRVLQQQSRGCTVDPHSQITRDSSTL